jgi:hypothetical protein
MKLSFFFRVYIFLVSSALLKEMGWECVDWIHLASDREFLWSPSGSMKCLEFLDKLSNCYLLKKGSAPWKLTPSIWADSTEWQSRSFALHCVTVAKWVSSSIRSECSAFLVQGKTRNNIVAQFNFMDELRILEFCFLPANKRGVAQSLKLPATGWTIGVRFPAVVGIFLFSCSGQCSPAQTLGSWVWLPLEAWISVCV